MQVGYISKEQQPMFASLLLPAAGQALERDEPLTVLGITQDKVACGAIAAYVSNRQLEVISLYVAPAYRRKGGGRLLVESLLEQAAQVPGLHWAAVRFTGTCQDHETLAPFLSALGFTREDDRGLNIYYTTLEQVTAQPFFAKKHRQREDILPFSQLPDPVLVQAEQHAEQDMAPLPPYGLASQELDQELSLALVEDGEVSAFVVFDRSCAHRLTLSCAWAGDAGPRAIPALLQAAIQKAAALLPGSTGMAVQSVNQASAQLIRALIPDARPISHTYLRPLPAVKGDA